MAKFLGTTKQVRKSQIKSRNLRLKKNKKPRDFRNESKVNYQNQNGEYGQKIIDNRQNSRKKVTSEISQQNPKWESMKQKLDYVHIVLDVAGLFPVVGNVADGINAGLYALRGDWVNAGLSATAMIPGIGQGATGAKYANKARKAVELSGETIKRIQYPKIQKWPSDDSDSPEIQKWLDSFPNKQSEKYRYAAEHIGEIYGDKFLKKEGYEVLMGNADKARPQGIDGIYRAPNGDIVVVEFKAQNSRLSEAQKMETYPIDRAIKVLEATPGTHHANQSMGIEFGACEEVLRAHEQGKLRYEVVRTNVKDGEMTTQITHSVRPQGSVSRQGQDHLEELPSNVF